MGHTRSGFSEEAMRGLDDLDRRLPPGIPTRPLVKGEHAAPGGVRPHYWGHRERLRQRFIGAGHAALADYELLELLLFNAIARIDVKPLAKQLIATFGDLNGVIAASKHRLLQVPGRHREGVAATADRGGLRAHDGPRQGHAALGDLVMGRR